MKAKVKFRILKKHIRNCFNNDPRPDYNYYLLEENEIYYGGYSGKPNTINSKRRGWRRWLVFKCNNPYCPFLIALSENYLSNIVTNFQFPTDLSGEVEG